MIQLSLNLFRYSINMQLSDPVTAISYFKIDERSGDIILFRSLAEDLTRTSVYKLLVIASDQGMFGLLYRVIH